VSVKFSSRKFNVSNRILNLRKNSCEKHFGPVSFMQRNGMTNFLIIRVILFCRYEFSCFPQDKQEREEEQRKTRIQLYVFISRCIAYPFNAKQPMDMTRRQMKVTKQQLETICSRFQVNR